MVLKPEPIFEAVESIWPERGEGRKALLLSAQGRLFDQAMANRLSRERELLFICGRYEGRGRARGRAPGRRRDFDRQLRVERRRTGGRGGDRRGGAADCRAYWATKARRPSNRFRSRDMGRGCWTARTGRGRRNFAGGRRRKCCWAATTRKSANSGGSGARKDGQAEAGFAGVKIRSHAQRRRKEL